MKTFTKTMKLVCKRIVVLLLEFCLMATGSVFMGTFVRNNIAAAEEAGQEWITLKGDWATLQNELSKGGYFILGNNFIDTSPNTPKGSDVTQHTQDDSATADYKAVFNVDLFVSGDYNSYPHFAGCGPLLIVKDTTIDLNGCTIDRNRGDNFHTYGMVFWVKEGAKLKIIDSSPQKSGVITGAKNKGSGSDYAAPIIDHGRVVKYFDDALKNDTTIFGETPLITKEKYYTAQKTYGGAFYVEEGTLILEGGTVQNNGDSFMDGKKGIGAGVYIGENSSLEMSTEVTFTGNNANGNNNSVDSAISVNENANDVVVSLNVTIIGKNNEKNETVYDGKTHTVTGYTVVSNLGNGTFQSKWVKLKKNNSDQATGKDVGTTTMGLKVEDFVVNPQQDGVVYDLKSVTVVDGYQTIIPRPVTLIASDAINEYTGSEITYAMASNAVSPYFTIGNTAENEGLAPNQSITDIELTGSGTDVGTYSINITAGSVRIGDNTSNYDITLKSGKLSITQNSSVIVVTPGSGSKTYDGTPLTKNDHEDFTVTGVPEGFTWTAKAEGSITNVGKMVNAVTEFKIFKDGVDVTDQFSNIDTSATGTLEITKRTVTLSSESAEKPYDGKPLTRPTVTVGGDGFVVGEVSDIKATGSVTTVAEGEILNTIEYTKGASFKADNYSITKNEGKLKTTSNTTPLVITSSTKSWTYDGLEHTDEVYSVSFGGEQVIPDSTGKVFTLSTGDTVTITPNVSGIKKAGDKCENAFTFVLTNSNSYSDVTISVGTLSIDKCPVTIKADNKTKEYDNNVTTDPNLTATETGVVSGDKLNYTLSRAEGQDVGEYAIFVTLGDNSNYDVKVEAGTFSITKCPVTIKADDKTKEYDNDAATDPDLTATVTGVPENGVAPVYTLSRAEGQDVKDYAISVNADAASNPNYTITVSDGTFSITQKEAALTWSDTEFPYDSKSHVPTATVSNLADGDTCNVTVEGDQTEIGDNYTATATALSNPNYKLPADASTKFKIYGCTITFVDEDGTELQSGIVEYGRKPSYTGKTPSKAATAQYSYEFLDWSPTITEVTGDKTYTATYKPILNAYTVTWKDEDGTVLETDKDVPYGTVPTYDGKEPTKAATAEYSFKFDGWSIKVSEVTGDITYTATYAKSAIEYTVEAENLPEGTQLSFSGKETVEAGKVLTFKVLLADGYEASDDLVVTVNGTKIAPNADGSYTIPSVMTNSVISVTGVVKVDYNLTEGENAEYKQGDSKNARFVFKRTVNDKVTFGRFTYAELDGKLLDPKNFTTASGSLILELKKDFLDTLPAGEHLLKVYFSDDKEGVIAHFLISAGITPTVTVTVTPAPDSNPTTGDTSNPILWIILIAAAVLGLIGVIYSRSRQEM